MDEDGGGKKILKKNNGKSVHLHKWVDGKRFSKQR